MKLPLVSSDEIVKLLQKEGFLFTRQKGSHICMHKKLDDGSMALVVVPRKDEIRNFVKHNKTSQNEQRGVY